MFFEIRFLGARFDYEKYQFQFLKLAGVQVGVGTRRVDSVLVALDLSSQIIHRADSYYFN